MTFVLDAVLALSWCFDDEGGDFGREVLCAFQHHDAVVPWHWTLEVSNGLLAAERLRQVDMPSVARFTQLLLALPIRVDPVARTPSFEALRLARAQGLTTYEAAYLELALRVGAPLATQDVALGAAATAEGVPLFQPA